MNLDQTILKLSETIRNWTNAKFVENSATSIALKPLLATDLNLVTEPGFYFFGSSHQLQNSPVTAGLLIVFNDESQSGFERHYQIIFAFNKNRIFSRTVKVGTKYQGWQEIHGEEKDIPIWEPLISNVLPACNINSVTTPGAYIVSTGNGSYESLPDNSVAGLLLVYNDTKTTGVVTRLYQIFIRYSNNTVYVRNRLTENTFTEWRNITVDNAAIDEKINRKSDTEDVMLKADYLQFSQGNIFDGNFVQGLQVANPKQELPRLAKNDSFKYLAILNVKPDTDYTIEIDNPVPEPLNDIDEETSPFFYYFKVYTATRRLEVGEAFDGQVKCIQTRRPTRRFTIHTGPNDAIIYIQAARDPVERVVDESNPLLDADKTPMPTVPVLDENGQTIPVIPYMQVTEGHYGNYTKFGYGTDTYVFTDRVGLGTTQLDQVVYAVGDSIKDDIIGEITNNFGDELKTEIYNETLQELQNNILPAHSETVSTQILDRVSAGEFLTPVNLAEGAVYLTRDEHGINYISGSAPSSTKPTQTMSLSKNNYARSTFVVKVEPNQTYTIFRSSANKEYGNPEGTGSQANYAKYATTKDYLGKVTYTNSQGPLPVGQLCTVITTGPEDEYLYVQPALMEQPDVQVVKGAHESLAYGAYYGAYEIKTTPDPVVVYTKDTLDAYLQTKGVGSQPELDADAVVEEITKYNNFVISKTLDTIMIKKGRTIYELKKVENTSANLNTWRWLSMSVANQTLFRGADCEGVVQEVDASDHIGGYHGDEKYTNVKMYIDGEPIAENAVFDNKICNQFTMIVDSDIYSCPNPSNKIFTRVKKLDWKNNKLNVYNTWKCVSPVILSSVKLSGMFSADCSCLSGYSCNVVTPNETYDEYTMPFDNYVTLADFQSIGFNKDFDEVTFYGREGYSIRMKSFDKDQQHYGGRLMAYDFAPETSLDDGRLKVYLESHQAGSSDGYSIAANDVLRGHFEITVNSDCDYNTSALTSNQLRKLINLLDSIED